MITSMEYGSTKYLEWKKSHVDLFYIRRGLLSIVLCHSSACWSQPKSQPHISGIKTLVSPETEDQRAVMGANLMEVSIIHGLQKE